MPKAEKIRQNTQTPTDIPEVFSSIKDEFTYKYIEKKVSDLLTSVTTLEKQKDQAIVAIDELNHVYDKKKEDVKQVARDEIEAEKTKLQGELNNELAEKDTLLARATQEYNRLTKELKSEHDNKLHVYKSICSSVQRVTDQLADLDKRRLELDNTIDKDIKDLYDLKQRYKDSEHTSKLHLKAGNDELCRKDREFKERIKSEQLRLDSREFDLDRRTVKLERDACELQQWKLELDERNCLLDDEEISIVTRLNATTLSESELQTKLEAVLVREADLKDNWKLYSKEKTKLDAAIRRED